MNLKKIIIVLLLITIIILTGCGTDFEIIEDLKNTEYKLIDMDSNNVVFPEIIRDKVAVVGYIFTNCPDICPLTTNNMRLVQEKLKADNIKGVQFVSISFDPDADKPSVLRKFAEIRNLDLSNWNFLTGDKKSISNLLNKTGIIAFVGDSTTFDDGSKTYYYTHTDRIQLIDQNGRIRKNYVGSSADISEIAADVMKLVD
jgi:protein SCO1/2